MKLSPIPVVITGANGLVGSVFVRDFASQYDFTNLDLSGKASIDITNNEQIESVLARHSAQWVVHFAAFTDVGGAWQQTGDKNGLAYRVNVTGTENIVKACEKHQKKLIHLSTAYVFSGDSPRPYKELDGTQPVEWYGQTKLWAEEIIQKSTVESVILRIDNPVRRDDFAKLDVAHRILARLSDQTLPPQFADSFFGPTCIEDVAKIIDWAIRTDARGLFHATANEAWTPFAFAQAIAKKVGFDPDVVKPGLLEEYLKRAGRPYPRNTALDCSKLIATIDFDLHSVEDAIDAIEIA